MYLYTKCIFSQYFSAVPIFFCSPIALVKWHIKSELSSPTVLKPSGCSHHHCLDTHSNSPLYCNAARLQRASSKHMVRKKPPQKWKADTWLLSTKKEQCLGVSLERCSLARPKSTSLPCVFSIIKHQCPPQQLSELGEPTLTDGAITTDLTWHLHCPLPALQPQALCHIPGMDTTTHRWVGSAQPWASNHNPSWAEQFLWFDAPPNTKPSFAVCKSHPFTNQRLLQPLPELKPHRKYQDLIE